MSTQTRDELFTRTKKQVPATFCVALVLFVAAAFANSVQAQSVTLAWDPVSGVSGYKVYQGGASRVYTNSINVGAATQQSISPLTAGRTYYFAVTAYNSSGVESDYSSELSYTVPSSTAPTITLTSPANGASYNAPATVHLAANVVANGHTINKVQFLSNGSVATEVTLAPYAADLANLNTGVYSYVARLVYDGGLTLNSAAANVTVTSGRPPPVYPLTFNADSGTLTAPFTALGGIVSQTLLTTLTGSGEAVYNFTIDLPGNYVVSAMLNAPSEWENSLYFNVDGEPTDPLMIWDVPVTSGFTNLTASWRGNATSGPPQFSPKVFTLTPGTHQLYVRGREPDVQLQSFNIMPVGALIRVTRATGRTMNISGLGYAGHIYEVQASGNLKTWTVLGNATADFDGTFNFTDTTAPSYSYRCYRLRDTTP